MKTTFDQIKRNFEILNKTSILSRIGGGCVSLALIFTAFKPFELLKYNTLVMGILLGMGIGFIVSHYITLKDSE